MTLEESDMKNGTVIAPSADYCLQEYVKSVCGAVCVVYRRPQLPAPSPTIMRAYGKLLLDKEYIITVYPAVTDAVKAVHYDLVCDLINASADAFVTELLEADPVYREWKIGGELVQIEESMKTQTDTAGEHKCACRKTGGEKLCQSPIMEA